MLDVIIIGAGPIGLFAAFNAGMRNFKGAIIESQPYVGGQLTTIYAEKPIYDAPGIKEIKAKDLVGQLYQQYSQFSDKVPLYLNTKFTAIESKDDYFVIKTSTEEFEAKTILFTAGNGGFNPRKLDIPGSEQWSNIIYLIKDLSEFKDKKVVVLGGGDSALDWGNMLTKVAKEVTLVHRRNEFRAHDESIDLFKKSGRILTPYLIHSLISHQTNVVQEMELKQVETDEIIKIPTDYILVNYGFLPSSLKYSNFNLDSDDKGLKVKQDMSTSLVGVYAAGNCVNYQGKVKTIASGFGEVVTAINSINNQLFPAKSNLPVYSSILMQKKK